MRQVIPHVWKEMCHCDQVTGWSLDSGVGEAWHQMSLLRGCQSWAGRGWAILTSPQSSLFSMCSFLAFLVCWGQGAELWPSAYLQAGKKTLGELGKGPGRLALLPFLDWGGLLVTLSWESRRNIGLKGLWLYIKIWKLIWGGKAIVNMIYLLKWRFLEQVF